MLIIKLIILIFVHYNKFLVELSRLTGLLNYSLRFNTSNLIFFISLAYFRMLDKRA